VATVYGANRKSLIGILMNRTKRAIATYLPAIDKPAPAWYRSKV